MKFGEILDTGVMVSCNAKTIGLNWLIKSCNSGNLPRSPSRFHCKARVVGEGRG